jgi:hypothetical protein
MSVFTTTAVPDIAIVSCASRPSSNAACSTTDINRLPTTHLSDDKKLSRSTYLDGRVARVRG